MCRAPVLALLIVMEQLGTLSPVFMRGCVIGVWG